jgi:hypothetical protein
MNFVGRHISGQICNQAAWVNGESAHTMRLAYGVEGNGKERIGRL